MYVRTRLGFALTLLVLLLAASVERDLACAAESPVRILLLHHSTGECVWNGGVSAFFDAHNAANETRYEITELAFPKDSPYGWENYPYDYYNIWVKHAGRRPYRDEPTLEILTKRYDVIVFKHCFPVSAIEADTGQPDVASPDKRTENYKLQYLALKEKLRSFPKTRFLVWTGAALGEEDTTREQALRARSSSPGCATRGTSRATTSGSGTSSRSKRGAGSS